jgi:hypothetical protein
MIKYDMFTNETNEKFNDFETALTELEKSVLPPEGQGEEGQGEREGEGEFNFVARNEETEINLHENGDSNINDIDSNDSNNIIMSVDLKNIIKQELASGI